jgi:tRNA threonylcarbamoyladenosine biosynthesis protein TsaB
MVLLVVDTSGKNGSVALARGADGRDEIEMVESVALAGGTFSAQLVPQIAALLAKHRYSKIDLSGFAVVSGPGSFTGLRVGLAAVKALAEILEKPIAAISLLEAVAESTNGASFVPAAGAASGSADRLARGSVLAVLDAGRQEVYAGEYELGSGEADSAAGGVRTFMRVERLLSREEFLNEARGKYVVTPDPALAEIFVDAGIRTGKVEYPNGALIARLGWQRIQRGQSVGPEELEANYIRRSDAEIFSKPKPQPRTTR